MTTKQKERQLACEAVRRAFIDRGESMAEWARTRDFDLQTVYDVLRGRLKGVRGEAHRVAVALGLKERFLEVDKRKV